MYSQLSIINSFDERIKLDEAGSYIKYYPNYLDANKADEILKILLNDIKWDDSSRNTYGKITQFNRKSSFYAFSGLKYPFSGRTFEGKSMTSTMCEILKDLNNNNYDFNSILFNYYKDGRDTISWHTDNEKELGQDPVVGTLSLGQERPFYLRHCIDHSNKHNFLLGHGSLMVMEGKTQNFWEHSVPQRAKLNQPRLSLTLRKIKY
jgi:alkylated DNA repair dioxygenase AlkB